MSIVAIDIGLKRIGVALCVQSDIVTPKEAILRKNRNQAALEVDNFLTQWQAQTLVVGVPQEGASAQEMQRRIKHFVSLLEFDKTIVYMSEDFSSYEAKEMMKGVTRQKKDKEKKGRLDSVAAVVILQRYLMSQNNQL